MPREKMEDVIYDIQLAQALSQTRYNEYSTNEKKEELLNGILKKHGITKAILDSSLVWYSDNVDVYLRVNDSVLSRLKREHDILDKRYNESSANKSLLENRPLPPYFYLTKIKPYISFNIDSFAIKNEKASAFALSFDVLGALSSRTLDVSLLFEYADTNVVEYISLEKPTYSFRTDYLKDKKLNNISGYVYADSLKTGSNILFYNVHIVQDTAKIHSTENVEEIEFDKPIDTSEAAIVETNEEKVETETTPIETQASKPEVKVDRPAPDRDYGGSSNGARPKVRTSPSNVQPQVSKKSDKYESTKIGGGPVEIKSVE